jgi:hypothetical protein
MSCNYVVLTPSDLSGCNPYSGYILAGYISMDGAGAFPATLGVNTASLTGVSPPGTAVCTTGNAVDQNSGLVVAGYKYYLCVIPVASGTAWSGTIRLSGMSTGTDYRVCRFQFPSGTAATNNELDIQPYTSVAESLDNQNYIITTNNTCPTISSLPTTLHQSCIAANPSRATDCPA